MGPNAVYFGRNIPSV